MTNTIKCEGFVGKGLTDAKFANLSHSMLLKNVTSNVVDNHFISNIQIRSKGNCSQRIFCNDIIYYIGYVINFVEPPLFKMVSSLSSLAHII